MRLILFVSLCFLGFGCGRTQNSQTRIEPTNEDTQSGFDERATFFLHWHIMQSDGTESFAFAGYDFFMTIRICVAAPRDKTNVSCSDDLPLNYLRPYKKERRSYTATVAADIGNSGHGEEDAKWILEVDQLYSFDGATLNAAASKHKFKAEKENYFIQVDLWEDDAFLSGYDDRYGSRSVPYSEIDRSLRESKIFKTSDSYNKTSFTADFQIWADIQE